MGGGSRLDAHTCERDMLILTRKEPATARDKESLYEPSSGNVIHQLKPASL